MMRSIRKALTRTAFGPLVLATILYAPSLHAQAPSWPWAVRVGGMGSESAGHMVCDGAGDIILTGKYDDTATFGDLRLAAGGGESDIFVGKYSPHGGWRWVRRIGSNQFNTIGSVAVDAAGNVYVGGGVGGDEARVSTGKGDSTVNGNGGFILAKYAPDGTLIWARRGGTELDAITGIAVTHAGAVAITGTFSGTLTLGEQSATSAGLTDIFVAVFSSSGDLQRLSAGGGAGRDQGGGIAVDANDNIYIAGQITGAVAFGSVHVTGSSSTSNFVLASYAPDGTARWAIQDGGSAFSGFGYSLAVGSDGNPVVGGAFREKATVAGQNLVCTGGYDGFIASYDANGAPRWVRTIKGKAIETVTDIATGPSGDIYVTGGSQSVGKGNLYFSRYRANGDSVWMVSDGGAAMLHSASPGSIAVDHAGAVYVNGTYSGAITLGATVLPCDGSTATSSSGTDLFIAALGEAAGVDRSDEVSILRPSFRSAEADGDAVDITYDLPFTAVVRIALCDVRGNEVLRVSDRMVEEGRRSARIDTRGVPAGAYFLVLQGKWGVASMRLDLVR